MKKIILLVINSEHGGETLHLDYKEQLTGIIINPAEGMNLAEMRDIEKVYDKLEGSDCPGFILLEDAEHRTLKAALEVTKFRVFNKEIKRMIESVIAAENINMALLKDNKG